MKLYNNRFRTTSSNNNSLSADLPKSQTASHVQSRSQDASSNTTGPHPSGSVQADTFNSGFVSPDKASVENNNVQSDSKLEAMAAASSNTTTEDALATSTTPSTSGSPKTYSSVAALSTQVERVPTGTSLPKTPLPVPVPKAPSPVPNATPPASQRSEPSNISSCKLA